MKSYKAEAVIIKKQNLGEADKILTIFSCERGKLRVLAKGVRKITSRRAGNLEVFNHVILVLTKGKNLDIVKEVSLINSFQKWRRNLRRVGLAYYFCELVDRLTGENQEHREVFSLLIKSLENLQKKDLSRQTLEFERQILTLLGFGLPVSLKAQNTSLKSYIEDLIEKKIASPKIIKEIW